MTKDKMIYNDDHTIGVDEDSLNKLDALFNHNNDDESKQFINEHIQIIRG